jgi:UPF0755 protein
MSEEGPVDNAPVRPRRLWRIVLYLMATTAVGIILMALAGGVLGYMIYDHVIQPGTPGAEVSVTIPAGATGTQVGKILEQEALLEHEVLFRLALKLEGDTEPIRHGVYALQHGLSATQLLALLHAGPGSTLNANQHKVTIPEGLAIFQMVELLKDIEGFPETIQSREGLEGMLMPNTYFFDAPPNGARLVERMLAQFEKDYGQLVAEFPQAEQQDRNTILTIASLIEEEARVDEERPLVAAVIYNRIKKGMLLQMDSTLQYALNKYGQRMLNADKEVDSPYNTYKNRGLPPGPISNPGVASIRAALQPAHADYLYFVSNADGKTHTFSRTAREHEQAVRRYRREIRSQRP